MEKDFKKPPTQLKSLMEVESLGSREYRGKNLWMSKVMRAVFGGQVMGQALMAAADCVSEFHSSFLLQSYHCYFVGPMQTTPDVTYKVNRVKDGNNFCSVFVQAIQNGKVCFHCLASFHKPEEVKADLDFYGQPMPVVPKPDKSQVISELPDSDKFTIDLKKLLLLSKHRWAEKMLPLEILYCTDGETVRKELARKPTEPKISLWMKGNGTYGESDHQNCHRIAIAYASDMSLARLVMKLYPRFKPGLITSLDHSMWFHSNVQADKWYLYAGELEHSMDGKALNSSRIYSEDGVVVATCKQESLLRPKL